MISFECTERNPKLKVYEQILRMKLEAEKDLQTLYQVTLTREEEWRDLWYTVADDYVCPWIQPETCKVLGVTIKRGY